MKDTTENNILLAEFMELKLNGGGMSIFDEPNLSFFRVTKYEKDGLCPYCHNGVSHGRNIKCYVLNPEKLQYDSDWNWLMEVVRKIEQLPDAYDIEEFLLIRDELATGRIETTYDAVVDFVKWYNNENK